MLNLEVKITMIDKQVPKTTGIQLQLPTVQLFLKLQYTINDYNDKY